MKIQCNLGTLDRVLRSGISAGMIYFGFFSAYLVTDHVAGLALGTFGVANLLVAFVGYCPLYGLIGFSTVARRT